MVDFSTIGRRVTSQVVNNGLQKVAGNLPGLLGLGGKKGSDSSDTATLNKNEVDTKMFQFPLDVTQDPGLGNQGHYMMFYINESLDAQFRFAGEPKDGTETINGEGQGRFIPDYLVKQRLTNAGTVISEKVKNTDGVTSLYNAARAGNPNIKSNSYAEGIGFGQTTNSTKQGLPKIKEGSQVISLKRPATRRLDTCIAMYMPNTLNATYGARYEDQAISPLASGVVDMAKDYMGPGGGSFKSAFEAGKSKIDESINKRLILKGLNLIDAFGVTGAREAFEIGSGEVLTDRMELAFKNVNRRNFTYNFKLMPKNSKEADEIRNIIAMFKVNMLPEMKKGRQLGTMLFPNTFDIRYMYAGKDNDYIHRVSTCVLETMTVTYGGDRYKTFKPHNSEGAPVVETVINLNFKELEIITRERALEGY